MLLDHEVASIRSVAGSNIEVATPTGHALITHVCKTIPMNVWVLDLPVARLECAGKHLVLLADGTLSPVELLSVGDTVNTSAGPQDVINVQKTDELREMLDLRIDSKDHIYYTNGIASHNSTGICGSELFKGGTIRNYKSLIVAPLHEHISTLGDKMLEMQRASVIPPEALLAKGLKNNKYYKEFVGGGSIKLINVLTDPTRARGNSAQTLAFDEVQDMDPDHLPEIAQVQKNFPDKRHTIFAGTSKSTDTLLNRQYEKGSGGVWNIPCKCPAKWHSMMDREKIPAMMSVDGLRCPTNGNLLDPATGHFVHSSKAMLNINRVSFHLPQVIVPKYTGEKFIDIWNDFNEYSTTKFLNEVWGLPTEDGTSELTEDELKNCCTDKTFNQTQSDYLSGKVRYAYVFSGVDWGGSDTKAAFASKSSYTVHTIYGMKGDGNLDLIYAWRYDNMNYREIAGHIVAAHNKYGAFAMGTDQGGGAYYNAYMRDCGRIQTNRLVHFQYTDTKLVLDKLPHPEMHILSLHRTDSISALIADIKDCKITWPRWDDSSGFVGDCLNVRRSLIKTKQGRGVMRFMRPSGKTDDFMMATNYASMMKRIIRREPMIPNEQIVEDMRRVFGIDAGSQSHLISNILGDDVDGGFVSG